MATYTTYKNLEKPLSTEKYNVGVANKNNDVIDSELHKLELKNESQDNLLATKESLNEHVSDEDNPHNVTKSQVGLANVDNTSDLNKPVSIAQQTAISESLIQADQYTDRKIAELINGAPETLDTLKEVADAIEENETIVETLDAAIGTKVNKSDILKNSEAVNENTSEGKLVDALVVKEVFQSVSNGKQLVASAITDKGIETEATDTFEAMAENIRNIQSKESNVIDSPLVHKFDFDLGISPGNQKYKTYFPIKKVKKLVLKSLWCCGFKPQHAIERKVYFEIYGKNKDFSRILPIRSFLGTLNSTSPKPIFEEIVNEEIEIDSDIFESIEYLQIRSPSVMEQSTDAYEYAVDGECIFELYF